jgi:hypothetical protein
LAGPLAAASGEIDDALCPSRQGLEARCVAVHLAAVVVVAVALTLDSAAGLCH